MTSSPLTSGNLADAVADRIREAIYEGRYLPGQRLVERTLASEFGVSHIPVREALARLGDDGLVERLPRRGCRVATLTATELEELSGLRIVLERFVARRCHERITPARERELRRTVRAMRAAAARSDYHRVLDLDQEFHEKLWEISDHRMLIEVVGPLRLRITAFLRAAIAALDSEGLIRHADAHGVLLDSIVGGDAEAAEAEMAGHIEEAAVRLRRTLHGGGEHDG
ncbi:GntR family transcriptional regulator [Nocardia brevicatena]|uniref:GntR family transcriptional regulator n=1 Tax=Nocardia brevicatena TaxID=37327 RepID=UPI0002E37EBE|nr:GntR family transcriptional regulator [Nocardia brevicatena]